MAATTTGPDFVSFQVRGTGAVSAEFYDKLVGLTRLPDSNPAATVFSAGGAAFAIRDPFPGVDRREPSARRRHRRLVPQR